MCHTHPSVHCHCCSASLIQHLTTDLSQRAEKIPQEQNCLFLVYVPNFYPFLLGFSSWTDLYFSLSYQISLAQESHDLSWEVLKLSLGNWPVLPSNQGQIQGQLPKVASIWTLKLLGRFLLTPKPRLLLGHLRLFDFNNAVTMAHCACTHRDLEYKGVTAGLHFQTCFASFVQNLWA